MTIIDVDIDIDTDRPDTWGDRLIKFLNAEKGNNSCNDYISCAARQRVRVFTVTAAFFTSNALLEFKGQISVFSRCSVGVQFM